MVKFNIHQISPLQRVGLTVTLGLTFLLGSLLMISVLRPPDVAQAQVTSEEGVTSIYRETSTGQAPFTTVVTITPTAISHKLNGVGVHMFDADYLSPKFVSTLNTLGMKYLRIQFGPNWDDEKIPEPPDCNDDNFEEDYELMYTAFISKHFSTDFPNRLGSAKAISDIAEGRNIKTIFVNWRADKKWITNDEFKELKDIYVDDYACFVVGVVEFLTDNGVKISYLEPTNEPSDTHDTKIPPERYNTFVTLLRKYLNKRGLSEIKTLGPGLAYLNHDNTGITWVQALTGDGIAAISVWAAHAWDPEFFPDELEDDILKMKWEEFHEVIKEKDPTKPIFITEYACVNDPDNGICAVENTITLLNQGANAVIYWYLREQYWDDKPANRERALLKENFCEKPMFTALSSVLPFISGDEVKVLETQIDGRITAASFYEADNGLGQEQITIALVNSYSQTENILIDITGAVTVTDGAMYNGDTKAITKDLGFVNVKSMVVQHNAN